MQIFVIIVVAAILYHLQVVLYKKNWDKNLEVYVHYEKSQAFEGEKVNLSEVVVNRKWLPLPVVHIKLMLSKYLEFPDSKNANVSDNFYRDDLVSIMSYKKITRTLQFTCAKRGYYPIKSFDIVTTDIFLRSSLAKNIPLAEHLYVYPKILSDSMIEIPFQKMFGTILSKRLLNDDPFEFAGIREYQIYDSMRDINWKASAKTGDLKVNVHDYTASQHVIIFLNLETYALTQPKELKEESIRLAATYANAFIQNGIPVELYTNAKDLLLHDPIHVTAGSSMSHMTQINEALARIDLEQEIDSFTPFIEPYLENAGKQTYCLFISSYQKEDFQTRLIELKHEKKDFTWIVPSTTQLLYSIDSELENCCYHYIL